MSQPPVPPPGARSGGRPPPPPPPTGDPAWPGGGHRYGRDASRAFPVPFTPMEGVGLVIWTLVAQLLVAIPAQLLGMDLRTGPELLFVLISSQALALGGLFGYLRARGRLSWRILGPVRPSVGLAAIGFGLGVAAFIGITTLTALLNWLLGPVAPPEQQLLEEVRAGGSAAVLGIVVAVALAPVIEEFAFRGVLHQALQRRVGLVTGAAVSALLFAVVHIELLPQPLLPTVALVLVICLGLLGASAARDVARLRAIGLAIAVAAAVVLAVLSGAALIQLVALFTLGVFLAWSLHQFGSLVVPIAAHAAFNGVSVGVVLLSEQLLGPV